MTTPQCPLTHTEQVEFVSEHQDFPGVQVYYSPLAQHWFASPEPSAAWLEDYYQNTYSRTHRPRRNVTYLATMQRRAQAQAAFIREAVCQHQPHTRMQGWQALDLGCGVGALVAELQDYGIDAVGYDSDPALIELGRQHGHAPLYVGGIADLPRHSCDLLCMSHLVEHLPELIPTMRQIVQVVRPGGYVFIEVPNCTRSMFAAGAPMLAHLHFFTPHSLTTLLQALGLEVVRCQSCGPPHRSHVTPPALSPHQQMARALLLTARLLLHRAPRAVQQAAHTLRTARRRFAPEPVRTRYDGYYATYYPHADPAGIWLRCLAHRSQQRAQL
jgi:2-polyprenyl-3-methyl-5-hydroxy-6-metoxy-1,4-benzoquinol methylase